jgi:predicted RNA-binding Zn-ribbon protein involved in translation (DUF1610 family)
MKTIAKENIPGRREFKSRFNRKLGATAQLFDPISEQLAEEAEKVIMDHWHENNTRHPTVLISASADFRERHYCPHCRNRNIYRGYNFCPKCGADVVWGTSKIAI